MNMYHQISSSLIICVLLSTLIRLTRSEPRLQWYQSFPRTLPENEVAYQYRYGINDAEGSGVVTDTWEERKGDYVKGSYSLLEPGGNVRTVNYEVDGARGFRAVVKTSRPGHYFLSVQQFAKSQSAHPEPKTNIIPAEYLPPINQLPEDSLEEEYEKPVNYHAINAEILGYQKLFGNKYKPKVAPIPSWRKPIIHSQPPTLLGYFY